MPAASPRRRKIAAMAEAYDVALALHCPLGPIALAAYLQLDAVCYNAFIQEQSLGIHYNKGNDLLDYLKDPSVFAYEDGFVAIPQGPGLGIEIDEAGRGGAGRAWPSLAQPGLAACRRQLRRMVNGSDPARARRPGSIADAASRRMTRAITKRCASSIAF